MEDRENGAGTSLLQEYPFGNFECRGIKLSGPGTFSWFRNGEAFAFPPGMTRLAPCYTTEQFLGLPDTGTACGDKEWQPQELKAVHWTVTVNVSNSG